MNTTSQAASQLEPFNFFLWRFHRRLNAGLLRARASAELGKSVQTLVRIAENLEKETLSNSDVEALRVYFRMRLSDESIRLETNEDLSDLLERLPEIPSTPHDHAFDAPSPSPDRAKIGARIDYFAGTVRGVWQEAQVPPSESIVPEYALCWIDAQGHPKAAEPLLYAFSGENVPYGGAVWDWILVERLSHACRSGMMPWPTEQVLVLDLPR